MTYVLDASALLAALNGELGSVVVEGVLDRAVLCSVNLAEVVAALAARGNNHAQVRAIVVALALDIVAADAELAIDAGLLRTVTDRAGLSLGDRFCLATARRLNAVALTADRAWADIAIPAQVRVELIR